MLKVLLALALVTCGSLAADNGVNWVPVDPGYEDPDPSGTVGTPGDAPEGLPQEDVADPNYDPRDVRWGKRVPRDSYELEDDEERSEEEEWQEALQEVINALEGASQN